MAKLGMRTRVLVLIALICVGLIVGACGGKATTSGSGSTSGATAATGSVSASAAALAAVAHAQVKITAKGFSPATVTIKKGGRVVWSNADTKPHAVQILGGVSSGTMKAGAVASHVFTQAGTFDIADPMNPSATAVVVVK